MKVVPITVEGRSVKHIVVDIADITFLASDVASASSSNVVGELLSSSSIFAPQISFQR